MSIATTQQDSSRAVASSVAHPAMAVGRPTKYDERYCDDIVAFCRHGYSITAFAGHIGVARSTIQEWAGAHEEFSAAVKAAKAAAALWWEERGRTVAERGGGHGAATMVIFNLKNMAPDDYADRRQHEVSGGPVQIVIRLMMPAFDRERQRQEPQERAWEMSGVLAS